MIVKYPTKIYRYIRFRRGHGVHSPFAFNLINKVIEEKKIFYIFEETEKLRSQFQLKRRKKKKYGQLLFRLVNFFKPNHVLQIGFSREVEILYLLSALDKGKLTLLEENITDISLAEMISNQFKPFEIKPAINIETLDSIRNKNHIPDFVFFNITHNTEMTYALLEKILSNIDEHTHVIFVIDSIRKNKEMKNLWKTITSNPKVTITMDLYVLGLVIFNKKLYKRNYKVHF